MSDVVSKYFKRDDQSQNDYEQWANSILWPLEVLPSKISNCKASDLKSVKIVPIALSALYVVPMIFYPRKALSLTINSVSQIPFLPLWVAQLASLGVSIAILGYGSLKAYEWKYGKSYEDWETLKVQIKAYRSHLTGFNIATATCSALYLLSLAFHPARSLSLTTRTAFSVIHPPVSLWQTSAFLLSASIIVGYGLRASGRFTNHTGLR